MPPPGALRESRQAARCPAVYTTGATAVFLFLIVQSVQLIAANISQKRRLPLQVRFTYTSRNSPRSRARHSGPSASAIKLHRKRAARQVNKMCTPVSGTAHKGHVPSPGPSLLAGRRSLSSCQTKILIFKRIGAFHNGGAQARTDPLNKAL